jgi:hypothetical protein
MRSAHKAVLSTRSSRANSPTPSSPECTTVPLHKRIVDTVFGAKGGDGIPEANKAVNPLSRLKLLLVGNVEASAYRTWPDIYKARILFDVTYFESMYTTCPCGCLAASRLIFYTPKRYSRDGYSNSV